MALYFGYRKNVSDTEELEKSISALKSSLATNNTKTQSLESSILKKDGTTQMTGDLDLGDNSIVGIHDINADNSVSSKKYIKDELAKKLSLDGSSSMTGTLILNDGLVLLSGVINMAGLQIRYLASPTANADAANKKYVDDKVTTNSSSITSLAGRVTIIESRKKIYNYHFVYGGLTTSYVYPTHKFTSPNYWMYCKGLTRSSRFHIHNLVHDTDSSIPYDYVFTFQLDFFDTTHAHHTFTLPTVTKRDKAITGENLLFIDERYDLSSVTNLTTCIMARLALKVLRQKETKLQSLVPLKFNIINVYVFY